MNHDEVLGHAEATYLSHLESHLRDLHHERRDVLLDEVEAELRTKPPASDFEVLVADLGAPAHRAARLRSSHGLPPPRRRAPVTLAGIALLAVAAVASIGLAVSWWLTYEVDLGVDGFAAGYGEILDQTGLERRSLGDRDEILVTYRSDTTFDLLLEVTNRDSRSLTITSVELPDETLVEVTEVRWRWTAPALPSDVRTLDRVELEPDGDRATLRLLITLSFTGCEGVAAGTMSTLDAVAIHYDALGRERTNQLELPADVKLVSPHDGACPARTAG